MQNKANKHGGARVGAGRKTKFTGKRMRSVTLTDDCVQLAKLVGGGNISDGIEIAVRAFAKTNNAKDDNQ